MNAIICIHTGNLLTGDCKKNIHLWKLMEGGAWHVDQRPYSSHTESVEDLQWSPNEKNVSFLVIHFCFPLTLLSY